MRGIKARHVLLISDFCIVGDFFRGSRGAPPEISDAYVRDAFRKTSRQAITSGDLAPVMDAGFGGHSVFTHFLVKELKECASVARRSLLSVGAICMCLRTGLYSAKPNTNLGAYLWVPPPLWPVLRL